MIETTPTPTPTPTPTIFESALIIVKRKDTLIIIADKQDNECVVIDKKELNKLYRIINED